LVIELPLKSSIEELAASEEKRACQYSDLADFLAQHCQALIALWDGKDSPRKGGTFEVVRSVLAGVEYEGCMEPLRGTVCHIITPRKDEAAPAGAFKLEVLRCPSDMDQIAQAVPVEYLKKSKAKVESEPDREKASLKAADLRRWRLTPRLWILRILAKQADERGVVARLRTRLWQGIVEPSPTEARLDKYNKRATRLQEADLPKWRLRPANWNKEPWPYLNRIEGCFRRADIIATESHKAKNLFLLGILFFVFAAAMAAATHSELLDNRHWLWLVFPACLSIALLIHGWARLCSVENWFLDSRVLAEALRVQYFWELGGVRQPVWKYYLVHRPSELGWVISALRGLSLLHHEKPTPGPPTAHDVRAAISGWVRDQSKWYRGKSIKQHESLKMLERLSNVVLTVILIVSFVYGLAMLSGPGGVSALGGLAWLSAAREAVKDWGHGIHWVIAVLSIGVGLFKFWLEQAGYDEQARNYRRMHHLFAHRRNMLDRLLNKQGVPDAASAHSSKPVKEAIDILCGLGTKALEENSTWLILHRDHPLKVTSGS